MKRARPIALPPMLGRVLLMVLFSLLVVGSARRAHAAEAMPRSMWRTMPPPSPDRSKPRGLFASVERWLTTPLGASPMLGGATALGRDASTSLGVRARGVHLLGASLAGAGATSWLASSGVRAKAGIVFGPRIYSGGGGMGISMRW